MQHPLSTPVSRRQTLAALGAGAATMAVAHPAAALQETPKSEAEQLLGAVADNLLAHAPEGATALGIDTGDRASMRGQLSDRSPAGVAALAATLKADLARVRAVDTSRLDHAARTSLAVVDSAYSVALDGFALPYGDVAVGGWRNTPYVVIQNVGAYLDIPRFLGSDHPLRNAADAEAYLARLNAYPAALDGETERLKAAGAQGLIAPAFRMTPEEVHQMGLDQLAELHGRMDPILKKLGYSDGSVGARMNALAQDPRFKFPEGDKGREEIKAYIQVWLGKIRAQLPRAFRTLVKGNVEVKRLPLAEEPGAPAAYGGAGSIDGSIPGKFWINLRTTDLHSKYSLPDLAMHEAIPGHVWQGEYANQMPLIRSILAFNAYSEGWALYAEQLADELGLYDDFEVGRLGYLQSLAFRACRLVVDTGLHAKRWTREEGVRFFVERNGSNPLEVASEVDRYCSWAGQACGYKVGHSEIVRQRGRAEAALGAKYDLRDFNNVVVEGGNVPLDVLAKNVDEYIAGAKA